MFPAQTSFIPTTVALVKFIEANGFGGNYPLWYLGTTPVGYLMGPVVLTILVILHKFLPNFSLFDLSYFVILASQFVFSIGWGMFALRLSGNRVVGSWVGILCLLLPWRFFSTMAFGEVSAVLAGSLTPWVLLAFARILNFKFQISNLLIPALAFAFLLLTNSTASIPAVVGLFILAIVKAKKWEEGVKAAGLVILAGWFLTVFWYGVGYYLTSFFKTPSIGGKTAAEALVSLLNLLRAFLPVTLAFVIVRFRFRPKNVYEKFVFSWLCVFVSITMFRFVSDIDFWMDWTAWVGEIEVGLVMLIAGFFSQSFAFKKRSTGAFSNLEILSSSRSRFRWHRIENLSSIGKKSRSQLHHVFESFKTASKTQRIFALFLLSYFIFGWSLLWMNRDLWMPRKNIDDTTEYRIAIWLDQNVKCQNVKCQTVFLSGSTAFWLNSLVDVAQVRGGRDEVSQNPKWREVNWQLTQGVELNDAVASLKELGVDFIVVHDDSSDEHYHDFKKPGKFESLKSLEKVYDEAGDKIYKIK